MPSSNISVPQSEGDTNLTSRRAAWQARALDEATRALLAEDARYFLRQSVSTPCLNAIARAEGIWIEDVAGRRYMDFHGNNVHHIGYGHPRLKKAIAEQMEALPFAPRRYANAPAVALAEKLSALSPFGAGQGALHHGRLGRHRGGGQDRPRRHRALQDALVLGCLPWRGHRRRRAVGGGAVPLRARGAAGRRRGARRALRQHALPLRHGERRSLGRGLRAHDRVRAGARGRHRLPGRRADPRRALPATRRLLGPRARGLRAAWHAARVRRDPDRARQDRKDVRLPARRRGARHPRARQGAGRRHPADRGGAGAAGARRRRRSGRSATTRTRRTR